jgi:muramoyltetrapeptide carboxypeptidase
MLEQWGLKIAIGETIDAEDHQYAGNDTLRLKNFQDFIDDDSINAILCCRGGYGTMRILDNIDFSKFKKKPKWIAGFSDVTALHAHINSVLNIATIHSSMPSLFPKDLENGKAVQSLRKALFGEEQIYEFDACGMNRTGFAEAEIVGGNLSLIYALQGSISDLKTDGKILVLEDLDEYLYHIDRMMLSIDRAGKLRNLKGLIVGGMTAMKDNEDPFGKTAEDIISEYASKYNYPYCFNFGCGHIEDNFAVKTGMQCSLNITKEKITLKQK